MHHPPARAYILPRAFKQRERLFSGLLDALAHGADPRKLEVEGVTLPPVMTRTLSQPRSPALTHVDPASRELLAEHRGWLRCLAAGVELLAGADGRPRGRRKRPARQPAKPARLLLAQLVAALELEGLAERLEADRQARRRDDADLEDHRAQRAIGANPCAHARRKCEGCGGRTFCTHLWTRCRCAEGAPVDDPLAGDPLGPDEGDAPPTAAELAELDGLDDLDDLTAIGYAFGVAMSTPIGDDADGTRRFPLDPLNRGRVRGEE